METTAPDVVYVLRDGQNEELRYSLRSLTNVPHGSVWLVGGQPPIWVRKDRVRIIRTPQGGHKPANVWEAFKRFAVERGISDEFYLFNDDFFVMDPQPDGVPLMHQGTMEDTLSRYRASVGDSAYVQTMVETHRVLVSRGYEDPLCYDVHTPMPMVRPLLADAVEWVDGKTKHPYVPMIRSFYGNVFGGGGVQIDDVKVHTSEAPPDAPYLSTNDATFKRAAGEVVRARFPSPSPYEHHTPTRAELGAGAIMGWVQNVTTGQVVEDKNGTLAGKARWRPYTPPEDDDNATGSGAVAASGVLDTGKPEEKPVDVDARPDASWKGADIVAWAKDRGIHVARNQKKAAMLAAIEEAS